jgi:hypothetical protein
MVEGWLLLGGETPQEFEYRLDMMDSFPNDPRDENNRQPCFERGNLDVMERTDELVEAVDRQNNLLPDRMRLHCNVTGSTVAPIGGRS